MYAALAYVPLEHIHEYYGRLSTHALTLFPENSPVGTKSITEFNEYFARTYVGAPGSDGGIFKHKFWNVRESWVFQLDYRIQIAQSFSKFGKKKKIVVYKMS